MTRGSRIDWRWKAASFVSGLLALPYVGLAQEPLTAPAQPCQVLEATGPRDKAIAAGVPKLLTVACGKTGVWIGAARSFESAYNPVLRSLVVVLRDPGYTRLILVAPSPEGFLKVDDVTREMARMSGRLADEGLGDAPVDLTGFTTLGRVSVSMGQGSRLANPLSKTGIAKGASQPPSSTERATLDLTPYAGTAQASR